MMDTELALRLTKFLNLPNIFVTSDVQMLWVNQGIHTHTSTPKHTHKVSPQHTHTHTQSKCCGFIFDVV